MSFANPASVFIEIPIQDVMTAVFNGPVAAIDLQQAFRRCLAGFSAGQTVSDLPRIFSRFFVRDVPFNDKSLSDVGEIKIIVQIGGCPYLSDFDSAMIRGRALGVIRFSAILKQQGKVFQKTGLIALDGKMVMRLTLKHQIIGNRALGQERIRRHVLPREIKRVQHGNG